MKRLNKASRAILLVFFSLPILLHAMEGTEKGQIGYWPIHFNLPTLLKKLTDYLKKELKENFKNLPSDDFESLLEAAEKVIKKVEYRLNSHERWLSYQGQLGTLWEPINLAQTPLIVNQLAKRELKSRIKEKMSKIIDETVKLPTIYSSFINETTLAAMPAGPKKDKKIKKLKKFSKNTEETGIMPMKEQIRHLVFNAINHAKIEVIENSYIPTDPYLKQTIIPNNTKLNSENVLRKEYLPIVRPGLSYYEVLLTE